MSFNTANWKGYMISHWLTFVIQVPTFQNMSSLIQLSDNDTTVTYKTEYCNISHVVSEKMQNLADSQKQTDRPCSQQLTWNKLTWKTSWTNFLIPSSSLILRIILTQISGILVKSGHSRHMSFMILITRFLTLTPVSWKLNN